MMDLQMQIELLEDRANEAELLSALACDPGTPRRNRVLADRLREEAEALRCDVRAIAA